MSDYTKTVDFAAKDSLPSGNAGKVVKGTEIDTEYDNIATAVATKFDSDDRGAANGIASLDSNALVPITELPAATTSAQGAVELATNAETTTGTDTTRAVTPDGIQAVLDQSGGLLNDISALTDPGADRILFWDDSAGTATYLTPSTGVSVSGTSLTTNDSQIVHDSLSGFVANEHVNHSSVDITAGTGLSGGGDITSSRTINLSHLGIESLIDPGADRILFWDDSASSSAFLAVSTGLTLSGTNLTTNDSQIVHDSLSGFVANEHVNHSSVTLTAGTGLTGGGDITSSRTFNLDISGLTNIDISDTSSTDSVLINDGGTMKQIDIRDMGVRVVNLDANQTFALGDSNTFQRMTGTGAHTWTVPANSSVAFPIGTVILVHSDATADDLTLDPAVGVTFNSVLEESGTSSRTVLAGGTAALIKTDTDTWAVSGDIG